MKSEQQVIAHMKAAAMLEALADIKVQLSTENKLSPDRALYISNKQAEMQAILAA